MPIIIAAEEANNADQKTPWTTAVSRINQSWVACA